MAEVFVSGPPRLRGGWVVRLASGLFFLACGLGAPARAQSPASLQETAVAASVDVPGRRSYLQAAMTQVRPTSFLKQASIPVPQGPEIRGALGLRRDALLQRHYARLAELDALADEAARNHELRLAEQIETARRRDTQQFFLAMQALKVQTLAAWAAGGR